MDYIPTFGSAVLLDVSMQMELTDNVRVNGADLGIRVISTSAERAAERASQSDPAGFQFLAGSAAS